MKSLLLCLLCLSVVWVVACTSEDPTQRPTRERTPDLDATVEAGIEATREAEITPAAVVATKVIQPTATKRPSPSPTSQAERETPEATAPPPTLPPIAATPTPAPTVVAAPAGPVALPTPTAIPAAPEWEETGYWYRDHYWEEVLTEWNREEDPDATHRIRAATLGANPGGMDTDLYLTLACVGTTQAAFLTSYAHEIPEFFDTYLFGIWDESGERYLENHEHFYYGLTVSRDGSGLSITYPAELNEIINTFAYAAVGLEPGQSLIAGMWETDNFDTDLWTDFDPAGIDDALQFLGCFASPSVTFGSLEEYAAHHANGPGAIYVGDLGQLAGPAPTLEQGDFKGIVTISSLENHRWIYDSPLYSELLAKAMLTNPTPMTYRGETIHIQHVCINRALLPCALLDTFFAPNLLERTNGKVEFVTSSFPELGLAGSDTLELMRDGTLDSVTVYDGYVGWGIPAIEIGNLWGIYATPDQEFAAAQSMIKDIEELVLAETGGVIMNHSWYAGNNQFLFCRDEITSVGDFRGKIIRSHSGALSDWLIGMGAQDVFLSFAEVYPDLERGRLDCGVTGADAGFGQRWYEVTDYLTGPLLSFHFTSNVINAETWSSIPSDVQQIILEEAARSELEALRLAAVQNESPFLDLTSERGAGRDKMKFVPFSFEIKQHSFNTGVIEQVVPNWVNRVGYPTHPIIADTFNNKVGPIVGLRIEADGSVVKVPITEGPHAGKTIDQVLAE